MADVGMRWPAAVVLLVGAGLLSACGGNDENPLVGREFVSESVTGFELVPNTEVRLRFEEDEIAAWAGCNHLSFGYRVESSTLKYDGSGFSTQIGCSAELVLQDEFVQSFLRASPTFALDEPELTLSTDTATMTLIDREVASPDRPLVGTSWVGDGYGDSVAVTTSPGAERATLTFDADGAVDVRTPCQHGTGGYASDASSITFTDLSYDGAACADAADDRYSNAVLNVLDGSPVTYAIEEKRLTITLGDRLLLYRATE